MDELGTNPSREKTGYSAKHCVNDSIQTQFLCKSVKKLQLAKNISFFYIPETAVLFTESLWGQKVLSIWNIFDFSTYILFTLDPFSPILTSLTVFYQIGIRQSFARWPRVVKSEHLENYQHSCDNNERTEAKKQMWWVESRKVLGLVHEWGKDGVGSAIGKLDLLVNLCSLPRLWSQALGGDWENNIQADTSSRNELPL